MISVDTCISVDASADILATTWLSIDRVSVDTQSVLIGTDISPTIFRPICRPTPSGPLRGHSTYIPVDISVEILNQVATDISTDASTGIWTDITIESPP